MKTVKLIPMVLTVAGLLSVVVASGGIGGAKAASPKTGLPEPSCQAVGGTISTNFGAIDANTTMGTATGDLRGAVSGTLLGAPVAGPGGTVVFHVQHHWVTESGETLDFDPATATTVPLSATLFALVTYPVHLTGGTGRYAGAKGELTAIGEVDLVKGTVFRYSGTVCTAEQR